MAPTAEAGVTLSGLAADATRREVSILFSGCPGFLKCRILGRSRSSPQAIVLFADVGAAEKAMTARGGTHWGENSFPIRMELVTAESPGGAALLEDPQPRLGAGGDLKSTGSLDFEASPRGGKHAGVGERIERAKVTRLTLEAAVSRKKIPELENAIAQAKAIKLDSTIYEAEAKALEDAESMLALQYRRAGSRRAGALDTRARAKLREAAAIVVLPDVTVEQKRTVLNTALRAAEDAVMAAKEAGLDQQGSRLEKAAQVVRDSWRGTARERLKAACGHRDPEEFEPELRQAVREAEFADLGTESAGEEDRTQLDEGKSLLEAISARCGARSGLAEAIKGVSMKAIRYGIKVAQRCRVDEELILEAKERLRVLEIRVDARWMMWTAVIGTKLVHSDLAEQTSIMARLIHAAGRAREMYIEQDELDRHHAFIACARVKQELEHAYKRGSVQQIRDKLREAENVGLGKDMPLVAKARAAVCAEDQRTEARRGIDNALRIRRRTFLMTTLPEAIEEGRKAGLADDELALPIATVERIKATKAVEAALQVRDAALLRRLVPEAERKGVDPKMIETMEQTILEEELLSVMDDALSRGDVDKLAMMVEEWSDKGLDPDVLVDAEKYLEELRNKAVEAKLELEKILRTPITFEQDAAAIDKPGKAVLHDVIAVLKKFPTVAIEIHGHSMHSNKETSKDLSLRRAESVLQVLRNAGCENAARCRGWGSHPSVRRKCVRIFPRWAAPKPPAEKTEDERRESQMAARDAAVTPETLAAIGATRTWKRPSTAPAPGGPPAATGTSPRSSKLLVPKPRTLSQSRSGPAIAAAQGQAQAQATLRPQSATASSPTFGH